MAEEKKKREELFVSKVEKNCKYNTSDYAITSTWHTICTAKHTMCTTKYTNAPWADN